MKELAPFKNDTFNFVPSSYRREDYRPAKNIADGYKAYIHNLNQAFKKEGGKVKQITFAFVAPQITQDAYELAWAFTESKTYSNIGNIKIIIELYTLEAFLEKLFTIIPNNKWFIKNQIPFNCVNAHDVNLLVQNKQAVII